MHACQVSDKADGTADVPAEVSDEEGQGNAPAGGNGAGGEGNGAHEGEGNAGGENGGDGTGGEGGNGAGGEGGGDGGDGNGGDGGEPHPEGEDEDKEEDEEEEEQKERDPNMPETPAGESSSSEEDWVRQGYSRDDIVQKRHQKEVRRKTAQSALKALDSHQEDFDQVEMTKHMDRSLQKERLLKEIEVRRKQEEQLKRREEALKEIEEKEKEKERRMKQADEEIQEMHRALLRSEQDAEEQHRANEEREKKTATAAGQVAAAAAAAAKEPELLAVKLEPADEDLIEEVKELSSLRMCNLCNTRNYLRQGLCCNMYCQAFYMLDPHAGEKLTSRGKYEHGAKWSPYEWQKHAQPRIECNQLAQAFQDGIAEYAHELEEAMLPPPQVEGAAKFIVDPVIIEDLESGEKHEHPPSVPPLETMPDEYKQAIKESSKRKQSKGVKRVLSLHAAIQKKKQKGLWVGPDIPMAGLTNDQQTWMNERVKKAIETAPWHRN